MVSTLGGAGCWGVRARQLVGQEQRQRVISMITGVVTLLVTVLLGALQGRQARQGEKSMLPGAWRDRAGRDKLHAHLGRRSYLWRMGDPGE